MGDICPVRDDTTEHSTPQENGDKSQNDGEKDADTFVPFFISDMRTSEDFPYNITDFFVWCVGAFLGNKYRFNIRFSPFSSDIIKKGSFP